MNLGKLLGVGRSIFGGDPAVQYRLNKRACLPRFNDGKNPYLSPNAPEAPAAAAAVETPAAVPAQKTPPPYAFKPRLSPQLAARVAVGAPAPKPARKGWAVRLNPFRSPESPAPSPVVQEELSLDAVKVMHNDLTDADVEVVPVNSHTSAPVAPVILPPARRAWEFVGESLMKSH